MFDMHHRWNMGLPPVILGVFFSAVLTLAASASMLKPLILGLGFAQALIQLFFFFHLGTEPKPRWNLISFLFLAVLVVVVFGGSLWIMYSLDYQMMPSMGT